MKRNRQIHLWIGLICSVFILLQSVTGLLLLEPWLMGGGQGERGEMSFAPNGQSVQQSESSSVTTSSADGTAVAASTTTAVARSTTTVEVTAASPAGGEPGLRVRMESGGGMTRFIKNLHEGRIGNADITWILDLAAIGMIILTITGIILSVKTLKAQQIRRKKLRAAA